MLDHTKLKLIGKDIDAALQAVGEKHGVEIKYDGGRFTSSNATLKLSVGVINSVTGEAETKERQDFKTYAKSFGLSPDMLDKVFTMQGKAYRVCGLKPRSYKRPVLAELVGTGKVYKFTDGAVKRELASV